MINSNSPVSKFSSSVESTEKSRASSSWGVTISEKYSSEHRDDVSPTSLYYDVNVQGTLNILEKMDEFSIKNLIFTSSNPLIVSLIST